MTFSERSDLLDLVDKLRHRVALLNMAASSVSNQIANPLGVLAEDLRLDLDTLYDGLEALEVAS